MFRELWIIIIREWARKHRWSPAEIIDRWWKHQQMGHDLQVHFVSPEMVAEVLRNPEGNWENWHLRPVAEAIIWRKFTTADLVRSNIGQWARQWRPGDSETFNAVADLVRQILHRGVNVDFSDKPATFKN